MHPEQIDPPDKNIENEKTSLAIFVQRENTLFVEYELDPTMMIRCLLLIFRRTRTDERRVISRKGRKPKGDYLLYLRTLTTRAFVREMKSVMPHGIVKMVKRILTKGSVKEGYLDGDNLIGSAEHGH